MVAVDRDPSNYEPEGREFESLRAHHVNRCVSLNCGDPYALARWALLSTVPKTVPRTEALAENSISVSPGSTPPL